MIRPNITYIALFILMSGVAVALERSGASFREGHKVSRGLTIHAVGKTEDKPSSRFFGGMPSAISPLGGFYPNPLGAYGLGGYQSFPYLHSSPYGPIGSPMNYGGMYPPNPGYFGNSFGGFSSSQQQQQQQQQQLQTHAGVSGFHPTFSG